MLCDHLVVVRADAVLPLALAFGSAGSLLSGSFGDCADTRRKRKMLEEEGVRFVGHKVRAS